MSLQAPCRRYFREYVPLAWLTTKYITYKKELKMKTTISNTNEEELFYLSEDAIFASVIAGYIGFIYGDDRSLWQKLTRFRLELLMPLSITSAKEYHRVLFILVMSQLVGVMKVEAKAMQKLRSYLSEEEFQKDTKINFCQPNHTEEDRESILKIVAGLAFRSGWSNVRAAFAEIDALNAELQIDNMDLSEVFQ